ncbi:MAG: hypothetical protein H7308_02835 [Chthonomonadaceae bacterium]|nr:hypothetical protein [Chthonomonadaceae bacterium]
MEFTFREGKREDFERWFAMECACFRRTPDWKENARHEWFTFFDRGAMLSLVIEGKDRGGKPQMCAFAAAVFVTDAFSKWLRAGGAPYNLVHATKPMADGSWPLIERSHLAEANTEPGLNLMVTHWTWAEPFLSPEAAHSVRSALEEQFFRVYQGYCLREILIEGFGTKFRERCEYAGLRCLSDFGEYYRTHPRPENPDHFPFLMGIMARESRLRDGCALVRSFLYTPPRFYFNEEERHVLCEARLRRSDREIAEGLCTSLSTIKYR